MLFLSLLIGLGFILIRKYEYTDEWNNFLERVNMDNEDNLMKVVHPEELRRSDTELKRSDESEELKRYELEELKRSAELEEQLRLWASFRGQTLTRTGTLSLSLSLFINYQFSQKLKLGNNEFNHLTIILTLSLSYVDPNSPISSGNQHVGFKHFKWEVESIRGANLESLALIP